MWWTCLRSGLNGLIFLNILLITTDIISNTGKVTHQIVNTGWIIIFWSCEDIIKIQDIKKPRNILPESPKNIFEKFVILKNINKTSVSETNVK